jgi:hypothetical protein
LIDVVVDLSGSPMDGLSEDAGVKEGGAGDVFGTAGVEGSGGEGEKGQGEDRKAAKSQGAGWQ